mmetsp:Transcript_97163/g.279176  ORF Transcript_97163/g.279176 Transcript_97163/m.279176 type:complete len:907 (+) Transcript_97163:194-2914(+)
MGVLQTLGSVLGMLRQVCRPLCSRLCVCRCCPSVSPVVVLLILSIVMILASVVLVFNVCMARLLTVPGAFLLNLVIFWFLLRLVVRILVFPGSIVLWRRNTEASYRVEMSKQFMHHLEHLLMYLEVATKSSTSLGKTASLEGGLLGCMVIEGLARNFRVQQRDQVRFTTEQARLRLLVQGVEAWLSEAKVCDRRGDSEVLLPLTDWLTRMSQRLSPVSVGYAVSSTPLASETKADADICLERVQQMLHIFEDLQKQQESCWANTRRFIQVPTVGSLHQLRAELLVRYSGHHYWVRAAGGRKIDAMFLSCRSGEAAGGGEASEPSDRSAKEDVPLKDPTASGEDGTRGPVIVWCNPNAAYYETMAYESHWLDFYLGQGCNVFLFNYSGFGRSEGSPTPLALAADGNAVVDFLRRRGFENIGVHGRSIGGIAACSLAAANPDVVKLLVADRTFSTLAKAAQYTFGNWATHGLSLSATWADNAQGYLQARCYKVMICDPRDATIPDLAALRTAVAIEAIDQATANERLVLEDDKATRLVETWHFFETLVGVCDRECGSEGQAKRPARQPIVGKPQVSEAEMREAGEEDTQRLVGASRLQAREFQGKLAKRPLDAKWLDENSDFVRAVMSHQLTNLRYALDVAGTQFNASGTTLDDALGQRSTDEGLYALKCFLANMQVWGSLGTVRERRSPVSDKDMELLLAKGMMQQAPELATRLGRVAAQLSPERLSVYHRQLSRTTIAHVRREFRQYVSLISRHFESPSSREDVPGGAELRAAVLGHLREIEGLLTTIYRFFKCVDIAGGTVPSTASQASGDPTWSDDSEDPRVVEEAREAALGGSQPKPTLDRSVTGYVMCIECGHNGVLNEGEVQHLALHIKAARFGKWGDVEGGEGMALGRPGKDSGGVPNFL